MAKQSNCDKVEMKDKSNLKKKYPKSGLIFTI